MNNNQKGFTLIETLIYIALFALIMGSGVAASFYVIDSAEKEKTSVNAIADAQFLLRKIDWALSGSIVDTPSLSSSPSLFLRVTKGGVTTTIDANLTTNHAQIVTGLSSPVDLTGDRVTITNLQFQYIPPVSPKLAAIKATFTAKGNDHELGNTYYELTRYLRK